VALFSAKKKIVEASQKKRMECETQTDDDRGGLDSSGETESVVNDGDMLRPSKKPPRQVPTSRKGGGGGQNKKKKKMKILFWNIRGLGALGRRKQLRELRHKHRVGAICLQETSKKDFSVWDLQALSEGEIFEWCWTAAVGHSGGTLTGVNLAESSVVGKDRGFLF
jgi:hypothetical protein